MNELIKGVSVALAAAAVSYGFTATKNIVLDKELWQCTQRRLEMQETRVPNGTGYIPAKVGVEVCEQWSRK